MTDERRENFLSRFLHHASCQEVIIPPRLTSNSYRNHVKSTLKTCVEVLLIRRGKDWMWLKIGKTFQCRGNHIDCTRVIQSIPHHHLSAKWLGFHDNLSHPLGVLQPTNFITGSNRTDKMLALCCLRCRKIFIFDDSLSVSHLHASYQFNKPPRSRGTTCGDENVIKMGWVCAKKLQNLIIARELLHFPFQPANCLSKYFAIDPITFLTILLLESKIGSARDCAELLTRRRSPAE